METVWAQEVLHSLMTFVYAEAAAIFKDDEKFSK